jgi:hypothetical protein
MIKILGIRLDKVYCNECKYYEVQDGFSHTHYLCKAYIVNHIKCGNFELRPSKYTDYGDASRMNRNNHCQKFEHKD